MRIKLYKTILVLALLASFTLTEPLSAQDDLDTMNFQGRLLDSAGQPIVGAQALICDIYEIDSGVQTKIWTQTIPSVNFTNGMFSVVLGDANLNSLKIRNALTPPASGTPVFASGNANASLSLVFSIGSETFAGIPLRRVPKAVDSAFLGGKSRAEFEAELSSQIQSLTTTLQTLTNAVTAAQAQLATLQTQAAQLNQAQTFTHVMTFSRGATISSGGDGLKILENSGNYVQLAGSPTNRHTVTIPDASFTFAGKDLDNNFSARQTFHQPISVWYDPSGSTKVEITGKVVESPYLIASDSVYGPQVSANYLHVTNSQSFSATTTPYENTWAAQLYGYSPNGNGKEVELQVIDGVGNRTTLSPHNFGPIALDNPAVDPIPFSFHSRNAYIGKEIWIDMGKLARLVQGLTGQQLIHIRNLPDAECVCWRAAQQRMVTESQARRAELTARGVTNLPPVHVPHRPPAWLRTRLRHPIPAGDPLAGAGPGESSGQ